MQRERQLSVLRAKRTLVNSEAPAAGNSPRDDLVDGTAGRRAPGRQRQPSPRHSCPGRPAPEHDGNPLPVTSPTAKPGGRGAAPRRPSFPAIARCGGRVGEGRWATATRGAHVSGSLGRQALGPGCTDLPQNPPASRRSFSGCWNAGRFLSRLRASLHPAHRLGPGPTERVPTVHPAGAETRRFVLCHRWGAVSRHFLL